MPSTPFIGLSVLVHLVIILIYKLFRLRQTAKIVQPNNHKPSTIRHISLVIISTVFIFITFNAVMLVRAAVTEKHSTINLFEQVARSASAKTTTTSNLILLNK